MTGTLEEMTSRDLAHLVHLARIREQREAEAKAKEIAFMDELRTNWRTMIPNRPTIGLYRRLLAAKRSRGSS